MTDVVQVDQEQFVIRPATIDDMQSVYCIETTLQDFPWSLSQFQDAVRAEYVFFVLVQMSSHAIVGFCILQPVRDEANLLLMGIQPAMQGKGLGMRLLEYALQHLKEVHTVFLEVRASNDRAQRLYSRIGFNEIGVRPKYYPMKQVGQSYVNRYEDAVLMALGLKNVMYFVFFMTVILYCEFCVYA